MLERVKKLRSLISDGEAAYITSRANIFYYSGFTSEDAALVITRDRAVLITDSRYTVQAKQQCPDFEIINISAGLKKILDDIKAETLLIEEKYMTVYEQHRLEGAAGNRDIAQSHDILSKPRSVKDSGEIKTIAEAERIGDEAISLVLPMIREGVSESDIALEIEFFMRRMGAERLSFETIAASGKRSSMPHGTATDKLLENGDFLTLDFGCVFEGYCSDMTRTVVIGQPDSRQREIYDVVLKAQKEALSIIAPGMCCADIDAAARRVIADAGYGSCFGHSLGHSVGIEIHEMPAFSPSCKVILELGHVITVEPGIYIEGFGGVRIEDLTVVTENGMKNLTNSKKELIII